MGPRRDGKHDIINDIVLETGLTIDSVKAVVNSFLGILQDKICDNGKVYIRGFGQIKGVMQKKRYYDINQRRMEETIQPTITFKPTNSFLNLIRHSHDNGKGE
jgi:nucleoid DNA-binding protein